MLLTILSRHWLTVVAALLVGLFLYSVYDAGRDRAEAAHKLALVQMDLKLAQRMLESERDARAADAKRLQVSQAKLAALDAQVDELSEYAANLEDANRECLSGADTDQLRKLWK